MSVDLWKIVLVPPRNNIVGLDLAPFSEMVVNHCCRSKKDITTTRAGLKPMQSMHLHWAPRP